MAHNRQLIIITLILILLSSLFYIFQPIDQIPSFQNEELLDVATFKKKTICDKVDIGWLAGDRHYWDGWSDKAMFIKQDGTFTQNNVYINQGEEICIIVLLGPIPASKKDDNIHTGPKDSIVMFANGLNSTKITIQLQQNLQHLNVYYTSIKFQHDDVYELNAINEYRSYFWESPILHSYHPNPFKSQNKLIVESIHNNLNQSMELCDLKNSTQLKGTWIDKSIFKSRYNERLFKSFENSEDNYSINNKVFLPDTCILEYKSNGKGAQCLGKSNIHVFGDNNMKKNLKALTLRNNNNNNSVCNIDGKDKNKCDDCSSNEEQEEEEDDWMNNPYNPLKLTNSWDIDSNFYFYSIQKSITNNLQDINQSIKEFVSNNTIPKADIIIIGLGNTDIEAIQVNPYQFTTSFIQFIKYLRKYIYQKQKIIIKTPQYFCCGNIENTSWNTGRSLAFTMAIRNIINLFNHDNNLLLWDVHNLGSDETICLLNDNYSFLSKRNVVNLENLLLWNLLCEK